MKIEIDKDKCKSCQLCIFYCPVKCLGLSRDLNKGGVKFVEVNQESKCTGCGSCYLICPETCIEIHGEK